MDNTPIKKIIFTAQSKKYFFCRNSVCVHVLKQGCVPLNPFRCFDYFLSDKIDRNSIRSANFNLIRMADELWVYGNSLADGVIKEIEYALDLSKIIKFLSISSYVDDIEFIDINSLKPEEASDNDEFEKLIQRLK